MIQKIFRNQTRHEDYESKFFQHIIIIQTYGNINTFHCLILRSVVFTLIFLLVCWVSSWCLM